MSDVVGGVDWATSAATAKAREASASSSSSHRGSVANMSLGGGKSPALDLAVDNAVEEGLHFAVAAGNDNRDACAYSPAASKGAITVGASTIADARAYFSNHGSCVDVFAPGLNILSTWNEGPNSINTISGTSMASRASSVATVSSDAAAHVAGLTAYFLSLYPTVFSPKSEDYLAAGEAIPSALATELPVWRQVANQIRFGDSWLDVFKAKKGKKDRTPEISPKVLKQTMIRASLERRPG